MIRRSTWILVAVLAVAAALTWFFELSPSATGSQQTPTATQTANLLPELQPLLVTRIAFSAPQGPNLAIRMNAESKYVFEDQPGKQVNQGAAYQLASELASIKTNGTMLATINPASIGLDQPALVIGVENARGTSYNVKVGVETAIGNGYYVQVGGGAPVIVEKSALDAIIELSTLDALTEPAATSVPMPGTATSTP